MLRRPIIAVVLAAVLACDAPASREAEEQAAGGLKSAPTSPLSRRPSELGAPEARCRAIQREAVPNDGSLVLIVSDTMRRDAASIYRRDGSGLSRARTPHFDAFAEDHLLFAHAISQAPGRSHPSRRSSRRSFRHSTEFLTIPTERAERARLPARLT